MVMSWTCYGGSISNALTLKELDISGLGPFFKKSNEYNLKNHLKLSEFVDMCIHTQLALCILHP